MDSNTILRRVLDSVIMAGCEPVMDELLNIIEEKDRTILNLSNSLNACKGMLAEEKEHSLGSEQFIRNLQKTYESRRSDVSGLCAAFLSGEDVEVDFDNVIMRYAKCTIPVEAEGFHFSIPVTYDTFTSTFSFEEDKGVNTIITDVEYFD